MARQTDRILLSSPDIGALEQSYMLRAMQSGWAAPVGPDLDMFEAEMAAHIGVQHAVALSSGTAALHLALVGLGVGPGDVVPVSTYTFVATANAIRYVGAEPFFVDCDEETGNMSPALLRQGLEQLRAEGRRVPVIMPVDMLGKAVDYDAITAIAEEFGAELVCDAAESVGATYRGRATGSFGRASVLSFNGNKVMTTSGGGMLTTDDRALAEHVRKLSTQARENLPYYEHLEVGYNYRLSNLLAAIGRAQLTRLDSMIERRRGWREQYRQFFADVPGVRILGGADDREDNCWLTTIVIEPSVAGFSSGELGEALQAATIETRPAWKPLHLQPVFKGADGVLDGSSEKIFERAITLPSGSALTDDQFARVLEEIGRVTTS